MLLLLLLLLLLKCLLVRTKCRRQHRRPCCVGRVEASCCNRAALPDLLMAAKRWLLSQQQLPQET